MIILKPDAFDRLLVGEILRYFEPLKFVRMYSGRMTREHCKVHYAAHVREPYYEPLCKFMTSGICLFAELIGDWELVRDLALQVRAKYAMDVTGPRNLIHASDSQEADIRETNFWFPRGPL